MKETKYRSKLIYKGKVYYNINHFNKFQKLLARIIWRIKIEDIEDMELNKLRSLLERENIEYKNKSIVTKDDGLNIKYRDYDISVVSHKYSYGGNERIIRNYGFIY